MSTDNFIVKKSDLNHIGFWPDNFSDMLRDHFFRTLKPKSIIKGSHFYSLGRLKKDLDYYLGKTDSGIPLAEYVHNRDTELDLVLDEIFFLVDGVFKLFSNKKVLMSEYKLSFQDFKSLVKKHKLRTKLFQFYEKAAFQEALKLEADAIKDSKDDCQGIGNSGKKNQPSSSDDESFITPYAYQFKLNLKNSSFASSTSLTDFLTALTQTVLSLRDSVETQNALLKNMLKDQKTESFSTPISLPDSPASAEFNMSDPRLDQENEKSVYTLSEAQEDIETFVKQKGTGYFDPFVDIKKCYRDYIAWTLKNKKPKVNPQVFSRGLVKLGIGRGIRQGTKCYHTTQLFRKRFSA